ncbi:MAG: site-2 protease family protein [Bacteroidota bacterium]
MRYSLRLGRIFNIPLYWHWSFLPVVAYLVYAAMRGPGPVDWYRVGLMAGVIVLLFGFVLVHELGHALTARRFGQETRAIIFFPLGGGALIEGKPKSMWREIGVYFAGPLSNLVLALICLGILLMLPEGRFFLRYYFTGGGNFSLPFEPVSHLLALSLLINVVLFGLNLLPAYPLDGGRILQALLKPKLGSVWSTRIVAGFGIILSFVLYWLGTAKGDWFMLGGAFFIGFLSLGALAASQREARLGKLSVRDAMRPMPINRVYLNMTLAEARLASSDWIGDVVPVFNEWNEVQGFVDTSVEGPLEVNRSLAVDAYDSQWVNLEIDQKLDISIQRIIDSEALGGIVYERGRIKGIALLADLMKL